MGVLMCDNCDWEDALSLVSEIEDAADEVPDAGEDFATSALETAKDIGATIEERSHATDNQVAALENILAGLQRWIR